jgi:hypothetical protein
MIMGERKYGPVLMCRMSLKGDAVCWTERMTKSSCFPVHLLNVFDEVCFLCERTPSNILESGCCV